MIFIFRGANTMTNRYDLLINSINATDNFLVKIFLFALVAVLAYPTLEWTPAFMRRPAKYIYLAFMLLAFVFTTVYSWQ
jgi:hypothetical protein